MVMPAESRDGSFGLEAWAFWERVRLLTKKSLEATGGFRGHYTYFAR